MNNIISGVKQQQPQRQATDIKSKQIKRTMSTTNSNHEDHQHKKTPPSKKATSNAQ